MAGPAELESFLDRLVRDVPDYPQAGVVFKDITPLLADPDGFAAVVDALVDGQQRGSVDAVVGIEARGFILAAPVAYHLHAGFVPVRKKGKLPARTLEESYSLEYGQATLQIHADAFPSGARVLVVDDVLATGGTAAATAELVRRAGGTVVGLAVLLELTFLDGRSRIPGLPVHSLRTV